MSKTNYVVLSREDDGLWRLAGNAAADTARGAIREVAEMLQEAGDYIAVPERSFQPFPVTLKTTSHVVVGEKLDWAIPA